MKNPRRNAPSIQRFVGFLHGLGRQQDRAALAALRQSAADPQDLRALRVIGSYLPEDEGWPVEAYRLTAVLFALHQQKYADRPLPQFSEGEPRRSFGASVRRLRNQLPGDDDDSGGKKSLDQRFAALLDTYAEDLAVPLRGMIRRIAGTDEPIPVDYALLLADLLDWERRSRTFDRRLAWARDYWQPIPIESEAETPALVSEA